MPAGLGGFGGAGNVSLGTVGSGYQGVYSGGLDWGALMGILSQGLGQQQQGQQQGQPGAQPGPLPQPQQSPMQGTYTPMSPPRITMPRQLIPISMLASGARG